MEPLQNLLLVSTCGTSIFTNRATEGDRERITKLANRTENELPQQELEFLDGLERRKRDELLGADEQERRKMSAELNGIAATLDRWPAERVVHYLIHSDTAIGKRCANLIKEILRPGSQNVFKYSTAGLRTDDLTNFRAALDDLTKQILDDVSKYRERKYSIIFNLTGGWKSVNAYLQVIAMVSADQCVFIFEGTPSLLSIPVLPLELSPRQKFEEHLSVFRRLEAGYRVGAEEARGVPASLLTEVDGDVVISEWGKVQWLKERPKLLARRLCDPLSRRLRLDKKVQREFENLEEERKVQVNEVFDRLAAHLDGGRDMPRAHQLKRLEGNPRPPSTHELYLWSDGSAWRAFGHLDGETFVVDSIGEGLH
jgi:putative CRISPR-associated protein (TIGR02619 family)